MFRRWLLAAGIVAMGAGRISAGAQTPTRPYLQWRTIRTAHFRFHFPVADQAWALSVARRIEGVDSVVSALVGYTPKRTIDVVIDNPYDEPNGSALPLRDAPVLNFWPVPPDPRDDIGNWPTWGEMLSAHEFAHLAHLMRPSRDPWERLFWQLMPVDLGPLPQKLPRWAIEGYATYVEGRVTGSGRPNGAWRAAVLRQWAIEGRLPTYDEMSSWSAFYGESFAYLAGSAFLQWLGQQYGDSTFVAVWRRATARVDRSFDDAFAGVYGGPPRVLYGRFVAQLTARAMASKQKIDSAGLADGAMVQHLDWGTGDPAFSRNGSRIAIVLGARGRPSRLVIWSTLAPPDTAAARRRRELLARDPEDVPARQFHPPPRPPLATLRAVDGQPYLQPRFLDDSTRVLVSRLTRQSDGTMRPDLYVWNAIRGGVRRVTHGAGVDDADPAPDDADALATQCVHGSCNVVRVDLRTGHVAPVLMGTPGRSYFRPRYSPDGRRFVVSASVDGRWELEIADRDGGNVRRLFPGDDANRYDATFSPSGDTLLYVTDRAGVIDLAGTRVSRPAEFMLTNVTGAAVAPAEDPATGRIWYLNLHAGGYDLRALDAQGRAASVAIRGEFGAASPPTLPLPHDTMPVNRVAPARAYDLGPRHTRYVPGATFGPDGLSTALYLTNLDVIGRLTGFVGGSYGARTQWNGGTAQLAWRGSRVEIDAGAHWARRLPSLGSVSGTAPRGLDDTRAGGLLAAAYSRWGGERASRIRVGVGVERLSISGRPGALTRAQLFGEWAGLLEQSSGPRAVVERLAVHADAEKVGADHVARGLVRGSIAATGFGPAPLAVGITYGRMSGSALAVDRFSAGGMASPLVDSSLTAARIPMLWLPNGAAVPSAAGSSSAVLGYRISMPFGLVEPFFESVSVSASDAFRDWHRGLGIESRFRVSGLSQLYLPTLQLRLGIARSFDAPYAGRTVAYLSIRYLP